MTTHVPVIRVTRVSKAYHIWHSPAARLKGAIFSGLGRVLPPLRKFFSARAAAQFRDFYALQGVSFEVRRGESVGIVGRNGSGKSTLLQIIAGTLAPTAGEVEVNGRVAALLELGSGFNPEFTGRENVYLNGAVLGLTREAVDERFAAIANFADIGEFIEQPVKTYSSGMQLRLAFAVAINVSADIIIVDEALAVGDINFQAKCITALRKLQDRGVSLLIVTHGVDVVKSMCSQGVYLRNGSLQLFGRATEVADLYFRHMREQLSAEIARSELTNNFETKTVADLSGAATTAASKPSFRDNSAFRSRVAAFRSGTGEAEVTEVELLDAQGDRITVAAFDQEVCIRIHVLLRRDLEFHCGYHLRDEHNLSVLSSDTFTESLTQLQGRAGEKVIVELVMRVPLRHGRYNVVTVVSTKYILNKTAQFVDWVDNAALLQVLPREPQVLWAAVYLPHRLRVWSIG